MDPPRDANQTGVLRTGSCTRTIPSYVTAANPIRIASFRQELAKVIPETGVQLLGLRSGHLAIRLEGSHSKSADPDFLVELFARRDARVCHVTLDRYAALRTRRTLPCAASTTFDVAS